MWQTTGSITVTWTSLSFFNDIVEGGAAPGTYNKTDDASTAYGDIYDAVFGYADGFFAIVAQYIQANGSMAEQFDREAGQPLSARDLTWSYAAFLTAAARRAGVVPAGWAGAGADTTATSVPGVCAATSRPGAYSTATVGSFPADLTPTAGGGEPSTSTSTFTKPTVTVTRTTTTTTATGPCATATAVAVTFNALKTTSYGQTVKIVGSLAALGGWDPARAVALSAASYTAANPVWRGTVTLPAGAAVEYKYIVVETDGSVVWEADPNRAWTVPRSCAASGTVSDTWR